MKIISRRLGNAHHDRCLAIMSVTGLLMFFHLDIGLNKLAHEWLGWLMVAGVAAHAIANWGAFKRYFVSSNLGRGIIGVSVIALDCSFISLPGSGKGPPPQILAMKAVAKAPIASVAPLTGRTVQQILDDLAKAGITLPSADANLDTVTKGNRELEMKAMAVLFRKA